MSAEIISNAGISQSAINLRLGNGTTTGMMKGQLPSGTAVEIIPDGPSLIEQLTTDDLEEISMFASDESEDELFEEASDDFARTVERGTLASIVQVGRFMEQMRKSYTGAQLEGLAKRILQRGSAAQMREMLDEEFGSDTSAKYMMLQYVISYGEDRGESEERQRMAYEALCQLEEDEKGGRTGIQASINAANEGYQFGNTPEQVQQFCSTYKDAVLDSGNLAGILQIVLSLVFPKGTDAMKAQNAKMYLDAIQRLIRALGDDISATRPSREPEKLRILLKDLNGLQALNTVLENCLIFSKGMGKHFSVIVEATRLMQELVEISADRWVTEDRFDQMPPRYGVKTFNHLEFVVFLKGVLKILGDIPVHIFPDAEVRKATVDGARSALDSAIVAEEESAIDDVVEEDWAGSGAESNPIDDSVMGTVSIGSAGNNPPDVSVKGVVSTGSAGNNQFSDRVVLKRNETANGEEESPIDKFVAAN